MFRRLTRLACASAAVALVACLMPAAHAGGTYVRDLAASPADVRWRHSGHQGPGAAAEYYGREMVTGDFNGDGRTDLVVSADTDTAPTDTSFGRGFVYVYFGTGTLPNAQVDPAEQAADCRIFGEAPFAYFGQALAVGDFDGDGRDDLAISQLEGTTVYKGAVFIISGTTIAASRDVHVADGDYVSKISGRTVGTRYQGHYLWFGFALAAGDFNGDGIDDIASGAFGGFGLDGSRPESGDVEIFLGRRNAWPKQIVASLGTADVFILGRTALGNFGTELAAGDLDGDGRSELVAATYGSNGPDGSRSICGDVAVLSFGATSAIQLPSSVGAPAAILWDLASTQASARIWGPHNGSRIGTSASDGGGLGLGVGDFDGDGSNDILIGSPFDGPPSPNAKNPGAVYVVWGGPALLGGAVIDLANASNAGSSPAALVATGGPGESLGDTVRLADFNHDGRADLIAGAPDANDATGYVAVFAGRTRASFPAGDRLFTMPDAIVRGPTAIWRFGDDAVLLDGTFAGRPLLAVGAPYGGFVNLGGRGYAGEVDGVDADAITAALPRSPSIVAQASVTLAPGATATVPIAATAGTGSIVSVSAPDLPGFAAIQTIDAGAGLYALVLNPAIGDRGIRTITLVATDSAGDSASRRVTVMVGFTPAITGARLKQISGQTYKLTIDGAGFAAGEAIVTVAGEDIGPVKYPGKFLEGNGVTVRRITVKSSRLGALVTPGDPVTLTVRNPREGIVSAPFPLTR